jgi:hypothetical protein
LGTMAEAQTGSPLTRADQPTKPDFNVSVTEPNFITTTGLQPLSGPISGPLYTLNNFGTDMFGEFAFSGSDGAILDGFGGRQEKSRGRGKSKTPARWPGLSLRASLRAQPTSRPIQRWASCATSRADHRRPDLKIVRRRTLDVFPPQCHAGPKIVVAQLRVGQDRTLAKAASVARTHQAAMIETEPSRQCRSQGGVQWLSWS